MDLKIKEKRALVMGASSGLGKGVAEQLLAEGAHVAIAARAGTRLEAAASELRAVPIAMDLTQAGAAAAACREAADKLGGPLEIVVINGGGPPKGSIQDLPDGAWQEAFQLLWLSTVNAVNAVLPDMRAQKWGRIIVVSSLAAREPLQGLTLSNGLRAGLSGLVKSVANEVAADGVTINALLPGYTRTERLLQLGIDESAISQQIPARRLGEVDEFAALAAFLASTRAAYITGQSIAVDGGAGRSF